VPAWARLDVALRAGLIARAATLLAVDADEIVDTIASCSGRPSAEAWSAELMPTLDALRWLVAEGPAALARTPRGRLADPGRLAAARADEPGDHDTLVVDGSPSLPDRLQGAERALAARGEYIATIAPCGLCHTPASPFVGFLTSRTLGGGMEARWRVYGSVVSTNLTPHPDGLRGDASVLRALSSGLGHDGRTMHWQAMPWDILSNWSEEDRRALVAYFKTLPPVPGRVPPPRAPEPGDLAADTFYFGDAARR
jgi:cytochrome c553